MYELERAERSLRDHIAFAQEQDLDSTYTRAWLALVLVYRGRWADGGALAAEVLAAGAAAVTEITANVALGRVRARRGDPAEGDARRGPRPGRAGQVSRAPPPRARRASGGGLALGRPEIATLRRGPRPSIRS